jgi:hypothetical protein
MGRLAIFPGADFTRTKDCRLARISGFLFHYCDASGLSNGSHNSRVSAFRNCIESNMASGHPSSTRKASPHSVKLIESYCVACGLLIAASPRRRILAVMEKLHECPVYFHYEQRLKRAS